MEKKADIIFTELKGHAGNLGLITLNRPEALNALSQTMIGALDQQLTQWETDSAIKAVVIRAVAGRAFCAGGDIKAVYERGMAQDPHLLGFFSEEYRLNSRIYHYPKPYIALLDGITMGGGVGIAMHGSQRIATEKFIFAMPETGIGFFPDIGASYFLSRMPDKMGFYLGLTGAKISASDSLAVGVVDVVVGHDCFDDILTKLAESPLTHDSSVAEVLKYFSIPVEKPQMLNHTVEIQTCFAKNTMEEIFQALENYPSAWCEQTAATIATKSPTSLKVTLRQLQLAARLSFDECIALDYGLAAHFLKSHDFYAGVRAVLIEKDRLPKWQPAKLSEVKAVVVDDYFAPVSAAPGY